MIDDIISIKDCVRLKKEEFVFVLAPFDEERTKIYNEIVKIAVEEKGYTCKRADEFKTNTVKLNDIVRNIWKSQFIIADITGLNPNVMYELGFSHAMNKEVIMIYEEKNFKDKFPFDVGHIEIIKYKNNPLGGINLKNSLEQTIDYVIGNITKSTKNDLTKIFNETIEDEFRFSVISNFEIRKRRIEYFTYHTINNLIRFKNDHQRLLDLIKNGINEITDENIIRIKSKAETMSEHNKNYLLEFTRYLLDNTSNFISNAWIVNKFIDYFSSFQIGLSSITNISQSYFKNYDLNLEEAVERNISDLDFCIRALNQERKLVGLETIDMK